MGNTGIIIQEDNSAGHCFVLRDLVPMNLFKYFAIMKLKMYTTGKFFFQYMVSSQGKDGLRHEEKGKDSIFCWGVTSNKRVKFKIFGISGKSPLQSFP